MPRTTRTSTSLNPRPELGFGMASLNSGSFSKLADMDVIPDSPCRSLVCFVAWFTLFYRIHQRKAWASEGFWHLAQQRSFSRMPELKRSTAVQVPLEQPIRVGAIVFPGMDQIDLTGPFAVLSRLPNASFQLLWKSTAPVRDYRGLGLIPDAILADAGPIDLLVIPGGPGQEELMEDEEVLSFIARQAASAKCVLSVCTGALVCGAAGLLKGRSATTHWRSVHLLRYFGAIPVEQRVVVDGSFVSAAGLTAGIDGALRSCRIAAGRCGRPGDPARHPVRAGATLRLWRPHEGPRRDRRQAERSRRDTDGEAPRHGEARGRQVERPDRRLTCPASDRHDDLADLLVRLQVAVGLDDLLERERPGDDRLEAPVGEPFVDELLAPLQALRDRS